MPNHGASEHLFTLKSIIALYIKLDILIIQQLFDFKKFFFYSEYLRDAMNSLFNREMKGKLYRLIYELNKDNSIIIKTGTGMTRSVITGENLSHGSIAGGSISANRLDDSIF